MAVSIKERKIERTVRQKKSYILARRMRRHWEFYIMILPPLVYLAIFRYLPMYGLQLAFRDFIPTKGIMGSPWVGMENFRDFFESPQFWRLIKNTMGISAYSLIASFPAPIILALALNEARNKAFKKTVQMVTYAPHFISMVVMVGMILTFLSPQTGIVNKFIKLCGGEPINFMGEPEWFKTVYVFSGIWQNVGYSSIIYLAALSSIDPQLYEAAIIDGASKVQKIWYIDIPGIMPTAIILLILQCGRLMNVGFQKIYLMQNPLNMPASDVIATYVYRRGLLGAQYSFATAVGLFNSVINLILILAVNWIAKRVSETSLW